MEPFARAVAKDKAGSGWRTGNARPTGQIVHSEPSAENFGVALSRPKPLQTWSDSKQQCESSCRADWLLCSLRPHPEESVGCGGAVGAGQRCGPVNQVRTRFQNDIH